MSSNPVPVMLAVVVALSGVFSFQQPAVAAGADGLREHARICSPLTAARKARAMGLKSPEIRNMTPRRVVVTGRGRHGMDRIVFANAPGCPLLRR